MNEINLPEVWAARIAAECFDQISTNGIKVKTKECQESGLYPVIDQGQEFISGFIDDNEKLIKLENPVIVFGDHTRNIKWVDFDFVPGADGTKILSPKEYLFPRLAFYGLKNLEIPDKGYSRHFKFLKELEIPLPPLAEQKIIADKLDTLLAQVETIKARLNRIPNILKTFRQSVLAAAVSGKLTEEWRKENVLSKPKEIQLGKIIGEGPQNGLYKSQSFYGQGIRIIRIDGFYDGEIVDWNNIKRLSLDDSEYSRWKLETGDVLVNRVNSIEYLGKSAIVRELPEPAVFESNIMKFRVNPDEAIPDYIVKFLCSISGLSQLRKNAKLAVNQASINQQDVKNCIIFLPEISEQTEIVRRVEELFAFADSIEQKNNAALERVNNLTQSILAKAFRGELTADWRSENPDLTSGENSAEALLAKIQAEREALALEKKAAKKPRTKQPRKKKA